MLNQQNQPWILEAYDRENENKEEKLDMRVKKKRLTNQKERKKGQGKKALESQERVNM